MLKKKRTLKDNIAKGFIYASTLFSVGLLVLLIVYIFARGIGSVNWTFLTTVGSALKGTVGIYANIINTLMVILITMLIATPLGIGCAIYLNEYAMPGRIVNVIEFCIETLSGIPSIIFGLFGMIFFGQILGLGYSILTGSLTLILMVLPLLTRNTQEALKTVPLTYKTGSMGLGAGKWYTVRKILLPNAMPGIITGMVLSVGRIVGESAALIFTAGSAATLGGFIQKLFSSGGTLTVQMYLSATSKGDFDTAFGIAVILIIIVLVINVLTKVLAGRQNNTKESKKERGHSHGQ